MRWGEGWNKVRRGEMTWLEGRNLVGKGVEGRNKVGLGE